MESQVVRRRTNIIVAHLASHEDISATATHVFPMICSNSLNSVIRRCDNRMYFARQCSSSLGCHMRPASNEQGNFKSNSCQDKRTNALEPPAFSRPAPSEPGIRSVKGIQSVDPSPEAPMFARPNKTHGPPQFHFTERTHNVSPKGKWSPRMDVEECGFNYVITLEIPGVSIDNIKVEVNEQSLIVTGNRSNLSCGVIDSNKTTSCYHRREILHGPYQIVWPLPANANKENVSAEMQSPVFTCNVHGAAKYNVRRALRWPSSDYDS